MEELCTRHEVVAGVHHKEVAAVVGIPQLQDNLIEEDGILGKGYYILYREMNKSSKIIPNASSYV